MREPLKHFVEDLYGVQVWYLGLIGKVGIRESGEKKRREPTFTLLKAKTVHGAHLKNVFGSLRCMLFGKHHLLAEDNFLVLQYILKLVIYSS
jgi:hypothetical protein